MNPTSRILMKAIRSLARRMNLKTIAEFVEDEKILELLKEMAADYAQS